jgi:hypothetical protein
MITENEQDELIFDFLEGNLSPDEQEAFLMLKDESELLAREVRLWENTYLHEALPAVGALEQKLLIRTDTGGRGVSFRLYTMLIMMLAILPIVGDKQEASVRQTRLDLVKSEKPLIHLLDLQHFQSTPLQEEKHVLAKKAIQRLADGEEKLQPSALIPDVRVSEIRTSRDLALKKISLAKLRVKNSVSPVRKKWSRREKRLIRKKKWNDSDVRQAAEFMKGNVPYVVPLNTNNF